MKFKPTKAIEAEMQKMNMEKSCLSRFAMIVLLYLLSNNSIGQTQDTNRFFNAITDDITLRIPPLSVLIDSAIVNAPMVRFEEYQMDWSRYEILTARRDWLRSIGVEAMTYYGNWFFDDWVEGIIPNEFTLTVSRRLSWQVGPYIRMPIFALVDRRNEIAKKKKLLEIAMVNREERIKFVRRNVIIQYNQLVHRQKALRISNEYQHYTALQMQIAEMQFRNQQIGIAELTRLKEIQQRGSLEFEQIKADFNLAYQLLEELVGINFNLINVLQ